MYKNILYKINVRAENDEVGKGRQDPNHGPL